MPAAGQSRHFDRAPLTSGLTQMADILRVFGMSQKCQQETHAPQQTTALFDHELLRRSDDSKSSIAPILNGPKNSGLHGNVLDRRRITEQSDLRRHR
jgi:hypothetical protein